MSAVVGAADEKSVAGGTTNSGDAAGIAAL